jgi:hypothetical protein
MIVGPRGRIMDTNLTELPGKARLIGKFASKLPICMVRRLTAREKCLDEDSLRQCIRPVCGD